MNRVRELIKRRQKWGGVRGKGGGRREGGAWKEDSESDQVTLFLAEDRSWKLSSKHLKLLKKPSTNA